MNDEKKFVHHTLEESPISMLKAFACAMQGITHAVSTQRNFKIHLSVAVFAIFLSIFLELTALEFAVVFVCVFSVFAFELVNTAIESIIDLVSPEWNELAKHAKDCAAGAVLLVSVMSVIVATFIFVPKLVVLWT